MGIDAGCWGCTAFWAVVGALAAAAASARIKMCGGTMRVTGKGVAVCFFICGFWGFWGYRLYGMSLDFVVYGAVLVYLMCEALMDIAVGTVSIGATMGMIVCVFIARCMFGCWRGFMAGGILGFLATVPFVFFGLMGDGDCYISVLLGVAFGVLGYVDVYLMSFVLGGCAGAVVMAKDRGLGKKAVPFVPFLFMGAFAVALGFRWEWVRFVLGVR